MVFGKKVAVFNWEWGLNSAQRRAENALLNYAHSYLCPLLDTLQTEDMITSFGGTHVLLSESVQTDWTFLNLISPVRITGVQ